MRRIWSTQVTHHLRIRLAQQTAHLQRSGLLHDPVTG